MEKVLFIILAVSALATALNVIFQRNPLYSALSLIGTLASLSALYLTLHAQFIAAIQIVVYAGAIMVLFIFVIMLLNAGAETKKGRSYLIPGAPLLIVLLGLLAYYVQRMFPGSTMVRFGGFQGGVKL